MISFVNRVKSSLTKGNIMKITAKILALIIMLMSLSVWGFAFDEDYDDYDDYDDDVSQVITVTPEKPTTPSVSLTPRVIVSGYSVKGEIRQGNVVTLKITLVNTSAKPVVNSLITFADGSGEITPIGTKTDYVASIAPGAAFVWQVPVRVSSTCEGGELTATISLEGETADGSAVAGGGDIIIHVPKNSKAATEASETTIDASQPRLMITSFSLDKGYIKPGESSVLSVKIKNMSDSKSAENLKLGFADEAGDIKTDGTGTQFVKTIAPGSTYTWILPVTAGAGAATGEHKVTVSADYEDIYKASFQSSETIRLEVRQKSKISYSGIQLPKTMTSGETSSITVTLMNTGKSVLSNVALSFDVDNIETGGSTLIGEMKAGDSKTASINLRADSDYTGEVSGNVIITYEDEFGKEYSEKVKVSSSVQEKVEFDDVINDKEKEEGKKKNNLWWLFIIIGVVAGGGIAAGIVTAINSAKQRKFDEENL